MEKMIGYEKFKHYMNVLRENDEIEKDIDRALKRLSPDFGGFFFGKIINEYLSMLKRLMHDEYDNIEYFIYDLDWGSKWKKGTITDENGKDIKMATVKDLYNYLKEKYDEYR